jgi:hypothetical protein
MGKPSWITYLYERVGGLETRTLHTGEPAFCLPAGIVRLSPAPTPRSTPWTRRPRGIALPRPKTERMARRTLAARWNGFALVPRATTGRRSIGTSRT